MSKEDLEKLSISLNECIAQDIRDCDLRDYDFNGLILSHCRFTHVDFNQVEFIGTNLNHVVFDRCDLTGASFIYAHLENTRFIDCKLDQVKVLGTALDRMIIDSNQVNAKLLSEVDSIDRGARLNYAVRSLYAEGYLYEVYYWPSKDPQDSTASQKPPLILLHGMTGHALDYEPLVQRLSRPVYAINLLGHGKSAYQSLRTLADDLDMEVSSSEEGSAYPLELNKSLGEANSFNSSDHEVRIAPTFLDSVQHMKTLIEQLAELDSFNLFDLMGYSMGGRLALHIAYLFNQVKSDCVELSNLLLISAGLGIKEDNLKKTRCASDRQWSDALWNSQDTAHFLTLWNQQGLLARLSERNPHEASRVYAHRISHQARGLAIAFDSLGLGKMPAMHHKLNQLENNIIWITGSEDQKYVSIAEQAISLSTEQFEHININGCGHSPHLEDINLFCMTLNEII